MHVPRAWSGSVSTQLLVCTFRSRPKNLQRSGRKHKMGRRTGWKRCSKSFKRQGKQCRRQKHQQPRCVLTQKRAATSGSRRMERRSVGAASLRRRMRCVRAKRLQRKRGCKNCRQSLTRLASIYEQRRSEQLPLSRSCRPPWTAQRRFKAKGRCWRIGAASLRRRMRSCKTICGAFPLSWRRKSERWPC